MNFDEKKNSLTLLDELICPLIIPVSRKKKIKKFKLIFSLHPGSGRKGLRLGNNKTPGNFHLA